MSEARIYLATPPRKGLSDIATRLEEALGGGLVACVRLDLPGAEEDEIRRAADLIRPICHAADVALVVADHPRLVAPLGLDGVHVEVAKVRLRDVRAEIGGDAILGAFCGASRHAGLSAAEAGVDYVAFGPVGETGALGGAERAEADLFEWWSEVIETPLVAEGGVTEEVARSLAETTDFAVPAAAIWDAPDIAEAIRRFATALHGR